MTRPHIVPVYEAQTPDEARAAVLRSAAIRRKIMAKGAAEQAKIQESQPTKRVRAIKHFLQVTAEFEALQAKAQARRWEDAVDEALKHAEAAHPLPLVEDDEDDGAIIPSRRVASKQQIIRHLRKMAARYGVTVEMVFGQNRTRCLVAVRHWMVRFVRRVRPDWSLTAMGRMFRRDHTSILHALRQRGRPRPLTEKQIKEVQGRA